MKEQSVSDLRINKRKRISCKKQFKKTKISCSTSSLTILAHLKQLNQRKTSEVISAKPRQSAISMKTLGRIRFQRARRDLCSSNFGTFPRQFSCILPNNANSRRRRRRVPCQRRTSQGRLCPLLLSQLLSNLRSARNASIFTRLPGFQAKLDGKADVSILRSPLGDVLPVRSR